RARVLLFGKRDPPEAEQRRPRAWLKRQSSFEPGAGLCRMPFIEVQVAEPHQGRDVRGFQLERSLEGCDRIRQIAVLPMQVTEIVGPAEVRRRQRLRVEEARLRRITLIGSHEQLTELAVRVCELDDGSTS